MNDVFPSTAPRAAAALAIGVLHVAALAVFAAHRLAPAREEPAPLVVALIPTPRPSLPTVPPVAMPRLPVPEIRLPTPPPLENLFIAVREEPAPPRPVATAIATMAAAETAPTLEPPRFDPAYLNNPAPAYPPASRKQGEQGRVLLRVRVDATGLVDAIELQASSGFHRLDEAALAAVRRWRFLPARAGERAVPGWALVPVHFQLQG